MSKDEGDLGGTSGISKIIPAVVLLSTITGFVALSWYAYHAGRQSIKEDDLLVSEAEKTPIKEKPTDPGGIKFPNQDKTIFETFSNNRQQPKVERVLPTPEEPITKTKELEAMAAKEPEKAETPAEKTEAPAEKTEAPAKEPKITFNDNVPATPAKKPEKAEKTEKIKVEEKKPEPAKEGKAKNSDSEKSDGTKIQLGAYGSEKEAQENWKKIQSNFSVLSDKSPIIVRAEVKGKGVFYRLRVAAADKAEAKSLCSTLSEDDQACILVSE